MFNFKRRDSIMLLGGRRHLAAGAQQAGRIMTLSLLTLIWLSAHLYFLAFVTPLVQ